MNLCFLHGLVCLLASGHSVHFIFDCCFEEHASIRLCLPFCCRLVRLNTVDVGTQGGRLCSLEDLVVSFCNSVGSSEVVEHVCCRCLLCFLNLTCLCL